MATINSVTDRLHDGDTYEGGVVTVGKNSSVMVWGYNSVDVLETSLHQEWSTRQLPMIKRSTGFKQIRFFAGPNSFTKSWAHIESTAGEWQNNWQAESLKN